ncbi:cytochrome c family protein [Terriglobus sp. RCC_193]|uniref:c-type cytochrome n=1 Tax=Terriglobus sp. RCC_193 TaxID=3239218 RepID=UPI00352560D0
MRNSLFALPILTLLMGCEAYTTSPIERAVAAPKMRDYGCTSCHVIPGVAGAAAAVSPPLNRMGNRTTIAGVTSNTPENLMLWIQHPQQIHPRSAMPEMHVTSDDARTIALYLETLH